MTRILFSMNTTLVLKRAQRPRKTMRISEPSDNAENSPAPCYSSKQLGRFYGLCESSGFLWEKCDCNDLQIG